MEDNDSNVSEPIKLIAENKGSTWVCEIGMISGSACSHVRLEMLNFCLGCQDADIILRKYYSLSSVVRDDVSNESSAKREVGKVAKTLEMQRHIFPASSGIAVAALVCLSSPDMI